MLVQFEQTRKVKTPHNFKLFGKKLFKKKKTFLTKR